MSLCISLCDPFGVMEGPVFMNVPEQPFAIAEEHIGTGAGVLIMSASSGEIESLDRDGSVEASLTTSTTTSATVATNNVMTDSPSAAARRLFLLFPVASSEAVIMDEMLLHKHRLMKV